MLLIGVGKQEVSPSQAGVNVVKAVYETNVFGVVRAPSAFIPLLRKSSNPVILNISSCLGSNTLQTTAVSNPWYDFQLAAYNSSKAAVNHYTITVAHDFQEARVYVIAFYV